MPSLISLTIRTPFSFSSLHSTTLPPSRFASQIFQHAAWTRSVSSVSSPSILTPTLSFRVQYLSADKVPTRPLSDLLVMPCNQLGKNQDRNRAQRLSWCSYVLDGQHPRCQYRYWLQRQIGLISTRSPSLPFLTPSSFARHPSSFVPCLWHLPQGGLYIWGIKENSLSRSFQTDSFPSAFSSVWFTNYVVFFLNVCWVFYASVSVWWTCITANWRLEA